MIRHAVPYTAAGTVCICPVQLCGGIIPDDACPDHGHRRNPAMEWHTADNIRCQQLIHDKETSR